MSESLRRGGADKSAQAQKRPRKLPRPRMCVQCGCMMPFRASRTRKHCSDRCWLQRNGTGASDVVYGIHKATNAERGAAGRAPVRRDDLLDLIAQEHAADMAARDYFAHEGPGGITCTHRAVGAGHKHEWPPAGRVCIMDNIAFHPGRRLQQDTARTFVQSWMDSSDGQRENMLDKNHSLLGVGVAIGRQGKIYAVQAFS